MLSVSCISEDSDDVAIPSGCCEQETGGIRQRVLWFQIRTACEVNNRWVGFKVDFMMRDTFQAKQAKGCHQTVCK